MHRRATVLVLLSLAPVLVLGSAWTTGIPGVRGRRGSRPPPHRFTERCSSLPKTPPTARELWLSDGTDAGTVLVKDIRPGRTAPILVRSPPSVGRCTSSPTTARTETSCGRATGPRRDRHGEGHRAGPGGAASRRLSLTDVAGTLFFSADDGTHGCELWKSDGTSAGTVMVKDIGGSRMGSSPFYLTDVDGTLFFTADDGCTVGSSGRATGPLPGTAPRQGHPARHARAVGLGNDSISSPTSRGRCSSPPEETARTRSGALEERWDRGRYGLDEGHPCPEAVRVPARVGFTVAGSAVVLLRERRLPRRRALEERRDRGRDRDGQGHRSRDGGMRPSSDVSRRRRGDPVLHRPGRHSRRRALEERWDRGRNRHGQGHRLGSDDTSYSSTSHRRRWDVYLVADDGTHGQELWLSDGTDAGTAMVEDIWPGG